jgi:hypothetical protein
LRRRARCDALDDRTVRRVLVNQCRWTDKTISSDGTVGREGHIRANNRILSYPYAVGDKAIGKDETIISHLATMTDLVATPDNNVIADFREGLNHRLLADEAMLADLTFRPDSRGGADVGRHGVPLLFAFPVQSGAKPVKLGKHDRDKGEMISRRVKTFQIFKGHNRDSKHLCPVEKLALYRKSDHLVFGIELEELEGYLREYAVAHQNQFLLMHVSALPRTGTFLRRRR